MTSYQARVQEVKELNKKLDEARAFERMFKNYIRAINNGNATEKANIERWFIKHSPEYARQIGLISKEV